ncbi:hypothetical protein BCR35DRAFT_306011 [Leucosporidium creatinivorum]|uniref:Uncharacterized protein n=1 Tax=Leucosporidium creatinivorum TaxID=106004 RepID=A0A1Y2EXX7_9BASI|nr:hypothetical protein BCR35DRAFT_306011 [Leucosporidium creatinivorum]
MPELNVDAISSLLGYMSTGLGLFLTLPSLYFGWRDEFPYISLHINWIWSVAEGLSLAGLLMVPGALVFQIVLVIWYLISDLAFVVEAIIINGYLGASHWSPSKFEIRRLRDFWTEKKFEEWTEEKHLHPEARPDDLQKALTRERNAVEHTFTGARWRRDIEIQISALIIGFFVTILFWYLVFFRNGSASKEYDWEKSIVSEFGKKAFGGWILGWISSAVSDMAGRIQDEYKVRNWVKMALNCCRRARKKDPRDDHDMQGPPDDDPYGVAAVCTVVFSVFMIDNMLQLISIFVILKGQDSATVGNYVWFQAPWIFGSTIPILLDARAIYRYNRAMKKGGVAKTHGKWWYKGNEAFPIKPQDPHVERAFQAIIHDPHARANLVQERKNHRIEFKQLSRGDRRERQQRLNDAEAGHRPYKRTQSFIDHERDTEAAQQQAHDDTVAARRARAARTTRATHKVAKRVGLGGPSLKPPPPVDDDHHHHPRSEAGDFHELPPIERGSTLSLPPLHATPAPSVHTPARSNSTRSGWSMYDHPRYSLGHTQRPQHRSRNALLALSDSEASHSDSSSHSSDESSEAEMRERRPHRPSRFALGRQARRQGGESSSEEGLLG